jgi:sugar lactone lactonase YvrE
MDWGPDDKLYGPRWFQGKVARVDVASGGVETVAEGFGVPAAVKFDSQGRLHVLDSLRGEVVRVDLAAGTREVVGKVTPSAADNLAFDAKDRLFVSSFGDGSIVEVLDAERTRTVLPGGINMPGGLALAKGGAEGAKGGAEGATGAGDVLYVADFYALRGLDVATGEEVYAARDIIGFSEIGSIMTVAVDGDRLITTSWFDNTVKVWDPARNQVVAAFTGLKRPVNARPFQGQLVVAEWDTGSVLRLDAAQPDTRTAIATGIATPAGLAAGADDLYVTDRDGGRVLQIVAGGSLLSPPREVALGLAGPEGIELGDDGALYVVEADGDRVSRIDAGTGETTLVADGLALQVPSQGDFPSTMLFNGIAVGTERIYVTGDVENVIYSIARPGR